MTLTYKGITTNYNELSRRSIKTINFLYQTINTKNTTPLKVQHNSVHMLMKNICLNDSCI